MTIKVNIANFKKVKSASFDIDPVTLLVGENENGKSSIALAVALTTTATPLPKGILKKDAKTLVNDGNKSAKCEVLANNVKSEVTWPLAEYKQIGNGKPIYVSEYAVGLKNIFSLGSTDRANYFIELLQANPTFEDLRKSIPLVPEEKLNKLWKDIEETGWDEAHSECKKEENELTGQWKMVTNSSSWNMAKAKDWVPEDWDVNLEFAEKEKLEINYANSKKSI
jgi:predicted ATP-dependent endonuclease of OLD family